MKADILYFSNISHNPYRPPLSEIFDIFKGGGDLYEIENRAAPAAGFSSSRIYYMLFQRRNQKIISTQANLEEIVIVIILFTEKWYSNCVKLL